MSYEYIALPIEPPVELTAKWWEISRGKAQCCKGKEPTLVAVGQKYHLQGTDLSVLDVSPSVHFEQHQRQAFCISSLGSPIQFIVWPSKFLIVHQGKENGEFVHAFAEKLFLNLRANRPNASRGESSTIALRRSIEYLCTRYHLILELFFMYFDVYVQQLVNRASPYACLPSSHDKDSLTSDAHELMFDIRKILSMVVPISVDMEIMLGILDQEDITAELYLKYVSSVYIGFSLVLRDMETTARKLENILFDIERVERQIGKDNHFMSLSQLWIYGLQA